MPFPHSLVHRVKAVNLLLAQQASCSPFRLKQRIFHTSEFVLVNDLVLP